MILGFTGKNGAGKTEAVAFFKSRGYQTFSLSDAIRLELEKENKPVSRESLIEKGRQLREIGGGGVLAERLSAYFDIDKNYAVDSIRNPLEVAVLKKIKGFYLIAIEAELETRFERCVNRARENEATTLSDFVALEEKELSNTNPNGQQLIATKALADFTLENNLTLEAFHEKLKTCALKLLQSEKRPSWDEYFMNIAKVASLRSNCIKRKVAAVIVKDNRVISTGYNGTPRGLKNCNEGGCPRCNDLATSGQNLSECLCSHAEENAIVQAAHHGVSVKDATLYTTFSPCLICTKMILNSGIREVVYNAAYPLSEIPFALFQEANVKVRQVKSML